MSEKAILPGSFRDPSGFVYKYNNKVFRQVNKSYKASFDKLNDSGLYQKLVDLRLLIPHREVSIEDACTDQAYKVLEPDKINFISYPYEFCFSQLKDAALTTLQIQKEALKHGMVLKDASAFNIQFHNGQPVMIDTLSLDIYNEGEPWIAYRQFCQHFLAPLILMAKKDIRFGQLSRLFIDGVPLDLASKLMPRLSYFQFSILIHIHLHARSQKKYQDKPLEVNLKKVSSTGMKGLIDNLESFISKLKWKVEKTEWGSYYNDTNYSSMSMEHKQKLVTDYLTTSKPGFVWDIGANTGMFSRLAADMNIPVVSFDIDPLAVEKNYLLSKKNNESNILPLIMDLTNPSPAAGWANSERQSLSQRAKADTVVALALIHHLAITNNLPLDKIAGFFQSICENLIIEFVPKSDSQVQRLLLSREDIFDNYTLGNFKSTFSKYFEIIKEDKIDESERLLFLMKRSS